MQHVIRGALLVFLASTTGCTTIVNAIAQRLANAKLREVSHEARVTVARTGDVVACFKRPGGACPAAETPALSGIATAPLSMAGLLTSDDVDRAKGSEVRALTLAKGVLDHPVHGQIVQLFNDLQSPSSKNEVTIDLQQLSDFSDKVNEATDAGAWDALAELTNRKYEAAQRSLAADVAFTNRAREDARRTAFVKAYIRAYFRNGKFIKVDINAAGVIDRLKEDLADEVPGIDDSTAQKIVDALKKKYGERSFGTISSVAFVTRDGTSMQFPAITAQLTLTAKPHAKATELDGSAIGADLVRIYFEAVFDAYNQLPGVSNATGVTITPTEYALKKQADKPTTVDEAAFSAVQQRANQADATASAAFGRIIRGTSWISLNNEALAKLLENIVGVTVKKVAEKAAWCWYSCNPKGRDKTPSWDIEMTGDVQQQVVTVHVQ
jgi:DNA uptake protein ComE-like DNA-binding protein